MKSIVGALRAFWDTVITQPFVETERLRDEHLAGERSGSDRRGSGTKVVVVLVVTAVALTLLEYVGMTNRYDQVAWSLSRLGLDGAADWLRSVMAYQPEVCPTGDANRDAVVAAIRSDIHRLTYWALACLAFYFVVPCLAIVIFLRESPLDYGLRIRGALRGSWIYLVMFGAVFPFIVLVSLEPSFQATYPFFWPFPRDPRFCELGPDDVGSYFWISFWRWELLYAMQFFALEFFFRGFMVHGLKERFGYYAVFVMVVPYCMIHFGKPMPETIGAIVAGVVLGSLSLKARSIWLGVAIHVSVALSMDIISLWRRGLFG